MKIYRGRRSVLLNHVTVVVIDQDTGRTYQLPGNQHELEWGYYGAGPARLAEALVRDLNPSLDQEDHMMAAFLVKQDLVSTMPSESWQLISSEIAKVISEGLEAYK